MSAAGLARHIPGGAEVTLRAPPPLHKPLDVVATDDGCGSFAMAPQSSPPDDRQVLNYAPGDGKLRRRHLQPSC